MATLFEHAVGLVLFLIWFLACCYVCLRISRVLVQAAQAHTVRSRAHELKRREAAGNFTHLRGADYSLAYHKWIYARGEITVEQLENYVEADLRREHERQPNLFGWYS